jgi:hypothetical protein
MEHDLVEIEKIRTIDVYLKIGSQCHVQKRMRGWKVRLVRWCEVMANFRVPDFL